MLGRPARVEPSPRSGIQSRGKETHWASDPQFAASLIEMWLMTTSETGHYRVLAISFLQWLAPPDNASWAFHARKMRRPIGLS